MKNFVSAWMRDRRHRAAYQNLMGLDDHLLADIGVTRNELGEMVLTGIARHAMRKSSRP